MTTLNLEKTALVIIDLQKGIAGREGFAPYSAQEVLAKNKELVTSLKNTGALIVFVHVKNYGGETKLQKTDNCQAVSTRTNSVQILHYFVPWP
ncbi:hypothetical protein ML8HA_02051 [Lactococcus lactis]|nr:hypothetical protein [Lactococcus lactis]